MGQQQTLFLTSEQKRDALDALDIAVPGYAPKTVRTLKRLLWAIDATPQDARIAEILAAKMDCSPATYARVRRLAEALDLVHKRPVAGDASYFQIDWHKIQRLAVSASAAGVVSVRTETEMTALSKKRQPYHQDDSPVKRMTALSFCESTPSESPTTQKQTTCNDTTNRNAVCVAGAGAMHVMNEMDACMHSIGNQGDGTDDRTTAKPPVRLPGALGPGGWPQEITLQTLRSYRDVASLADFAIGRRWIGESDRLAFFALASAVQRTAKGLKSPGGAFTTRVKARDWTPANSGDWAAARKALAWLDNQRATATAGEAPS